MAEWTVAVDRPVPALYARQDSERREDTDMSTNGDDQVHRMLPGSHERPGGAECVCGAAWSRWADQCCRPVSELDQLRRVAAAARSLLEGEFRSRDHEGWVEFTERRVAELRTALGATS